MANCQNNVRYIRQSGNRQQRQSRQGCGNNVGVRAEVECGCEVRDRDTTCCEREVCDSCTTGCGREACDRDRREDKLQGFPLAMAYVPWQDWDDLYCACKALQAGTVFAELDKPFLGRGGCNR